MAPLELSWHFDARHHLYQWYGGVQIVGRRAVGQWFCVDLDSGRCLWERRLPRANTIRAIADGVIVASEMRSDGPWTADFGVYAIALESGDLLWTSHREGLAGTVTATCEANRVEPIAYLTDVLGRVGSHPAAALDDLLPHKWRPSG